MTSEGFKNGIGNRWWRGCKLAPREHSVPEGQKHPLWQSLQATHPGNTPLFWCQGSRGDFPFIHAPAPWMDLPKKGVRSVHPTLAGYIFTSGVFSFDHILCIPHLLSEPWSACFYLILCRQGSSLDYPEDYGQEGWGVGFYTCHLGRH